MLSLRQTQAFLAPTGDPNAVHMGKAKLQECLGHFKALYWHYWTAHWQVRGDSAYADHLLFERFYTAMVAEIDTLAEKIVGYYGSEAVDPEQVAAHEADWRRQFADIDCLHRRALEMETALQQKLKEGRAMLDAEGLLPLGLDDFIQELANAHDTNMYLLQQRLGDKPELLPGQRVGYLTSLERGWNGTSTFDPIRRGDDEEEEDEENELLALWFKTTGGNS